MEDTSDSEEEYTQNEKLLLENARKSLGNQSNESDEDEVFGLGSVADDDEDEDLFHGGEAGDDGSDINMDSDLEDKDDGLPDDRAWGKKKRNFYSTDYVDQDYGGVLQEKDAEAAELEEQEARNIQKRLLEQLNDADFELSELTEVPSTETKELIKSDLTQLSKRQKLDLMMKESPEFFSLTEDFTAKLSEAEEKLIKLLKYAETKKIPYLQNFVQTKLQIVLNYCVNIMFYLLLKAKRTSVKDHPVLKSLFRYRQLLEQLAAVENAVGPKIDKLLAAADQNTSTPTKKKLLKLLKAKKKKPKEKIKDTPTEVEVENVDVDEAEGSVSDESEDLIKNESKVQNVDENNEKRAITYEMAKNKGLIPKRSKEQRNPRVKHRNKYRKAKIRRRGQVRTPRQEVPVYGGEATGIKIGLTKSIKFK